MIITSLVEDLIFATIMVLLIFGSYAFMGFTNIPMKVNVNNNNLVNPNEPLDLVIN